MYEKVFSTTKKELPLVALFNQEKNPFHTQRIFPSVRAKLRDFGFFFRIFLADLKPSLKKPKLYLTLWLRSDSYRD
jgi:hypothetical protein